MCRSNSRGRGRSAPRAGRWRRLRWRRRRGRAGPRWCGCCGRSSRPGCRPWTAWPGDLRVVLGAGGVSVPEPGLQLEQGHRLFGVVELAGDGGPGPVAGDLAPDVGGGDADRDPLWDCRGSSLQAGAGSRQAHPGRVVPAASMTGAPRPVSDKGFDTLSSEVRSTFHDCRAAQPAGRGASRASNGEYLPRSPVSAPSVRRRDTFRYELGYRFS
jgi:hypothetical protein